MKTRITGFDVARALAIFGMVIVNFKIAMNASTGSSVLLSMANLLDGRASALFVILAGIGIAFLSAKARKTSDTEIVAKARRQVIKRGLLLIALGLLYTPIWEADILHFYGFYFLGAAIFLTASNKALIRAALGIMLLFPLLMLFFDYEKNWDWDTLTYTNLWSLDGMLRHIFFNGFHPVFPWAAFLLYGMWLGRQDLSDPGLRKRLLLGSLAVLVAVEAGFYFMRHFLGDGRSFGMNAEEVAFLFSTDIIPPLPQYVVSATSSSTMVLIACLYFSERFGRSFANRLLCKTGQMSLSLYVAHVLVGMGLLEYWGYLENQTIDFALFSALVFCILATAFSAFWLSHFKSGPLEWVFRKLAS